MKRYRVGVVGCGQIAQIMHIPYLWEMPEFEIRALCDLSPSVVNSLGNQYRVNQLYSDYRELVVQDDLDVVAIFTPEHANIAEAAAEAGKHIFVEKPFCFNLVDCDRVLEAAHRNKVKIMVGYMKRYDPGYEYGANLIKLMEEIRYIRVHDFVGDLKSHQGLYDIFTADDLPKTALYEMIQSVNNSLMQALGESHSHLYKILWELLMSSHDIDLLLGTFGPPQKILFSDAITRTEFISLMEYGKSTRCVFEIGIWPDYRNWDEQLVAYGRDSIVSINFPNPYIKNAPTIVNIVNHEDESGVHKEVRPSFNEAFKLEWHHFYKCMSEDQEPRTNGQVGRAAVELAIELVRAINL